MTPIKLLPVPQTGYQPLAISTELQKQSLSRRIAADRTDLFVNDADEAIHTLGRLALRRGRLLAMDAFALGDLCAQRSLSGQQLLILYVGKTFAAYRRAEAAADPANPAERETAKKAIADFGHWLTHVAEQIPTARNIAVALWAISEWQPAVSPLAYQTALAALSSQMNDSRARPPEARREREQLPMVRPVMATPPSAPDLFPVTNVGVLPDADDSVALPADEQPTVAPDVPLEPIIPHMPLQTDRSAAPGEYRRGERIGPKSDPERYEIYRMWRGGMGIVYAAYDRAERYPVALKTIQSRLDRRAERDLYDRFVHEARTWIKLEKHPHVVQALIVQTIADRPYLALEYVGGPEGLGSDLSRWIEHRRIDLPLALEIALHICRGMQHAVTRVPNLVHRDLKPANILVTTDGVAKVTDFGLAYAVHPVDLAALARSTSAADGQGRLTHAGGVPGTPQYLSPEQCQAELLDARSDMYALGIILFEMLTNRPLYSARTTTEWLTAHLTGTPQFPDDVVAVQSIPAAVRELVLRCLARRRDDRPETWDALAVELAELYETITGQPVAASAEGESLAARELMDTGYSLGEIGHYDEALDAYSRALAIDPGSHWGWGRKGRTLRILRRYDEALACFDRALALNPRYAWAANQRGIVLAQQGKHVAAVGAYQTAAQLRPNDPWPLYNQAELLEKDKQFEAALGLIDQALAVDPAHSQSFAERGRILSTLKRYDEALVAYDEALQQSSGDGWVWYGKGLALYRLKRYEEAVSVLGHATRSRAKTVSARSWFMLAETLNSLKRYDEALGAIQQVVRLRPDDALAWSKQGKILVRTRRYGEALAAFSNAVRIAPEALDNWVDQAETLIKLKRYAEAVDAIAQALELVPDEGLRDSQAARIWGARGQVLRIFGRYKEAVTAYDNALRAAPRSAWYWHGRGLALEQMNRVHDAIESYEQAVQIAPNVGWYRESQIELLLTAGEIDDALNIAEQATVDLATNARVWARLGQILRRLNRHTDAVQAYEKALTLDADFGWAWTGKGLALAALERWEEAIHNYEQAILLPQVDVWTWYHYAKALMAVHRYGDAEQALEKGLRLNPNHKSSQTLRLEANQRAND